jgi:hypothetical protein
LILVRIDYTHLAYVIVDSVGPRARTINWYGDNINKSGTTWGYLTSDPLIRLLQYSWHNWTSGNPRREIMIYVVSDQEELEKLLCEIEKVTPINATLRARISNQLKIIKGGSHARNQNSTS